MVKLDQHLRSSMRLQDKTNEDLSKDGAEARKTDANDPHPECQDRLSRVILEGDEARSDINVGLYESKRKYIIRKISWSFTGQREPMTFSLLSVTSSQTATGSEEEREVSDSLSTAFSSYEPSRTLS